MKRHLFVIVFAVVAVTAAGSIVVAHDAPVQTTLFINVTSDDLWNCQMATGYAERVHAIGYRVVLFLNVRAVHLIDNKRPQPTMAVIEKTPVEMLASLIRHGIEVYVCPMCLEQAGIEKEDWIAGVKEADPEMVKIQMDPKTKIMSY